jgi:hypothetical protein
MIHYQRHLAPFNAHSFQVDHNLFEILPKSARSTPKVLCALLNSTFANLVRELVGRTTLGQGALKTEGIDIAGMWLPDPRKLSARQAQALESAFDALASRPVGPIFEELENGRRSIRRWWTWYAPALNGPRAWWGAGRCACWLWTWVSDAWGSP